MSPIPLTTENTEFTEKNNSVDAHVIGQIQLEAAIEYYNKKNYICAITLARATEEYLGKLLIYSTGKTTSFYELQNEIKEKYGENINLNYIANSLKHFDENFCETEHNINSDALQLIYRAVINFGRLNIPYLKVINNFLQTHNTHNINKKTSVPSSMNSMPSLVKKSDEEMNTITGKIINCAIYVHKQLGIGLLESAYQYGLAFALAKENLKFEKEKSISIMIDNHILDAGYRVDFIVENEIIVEIKSVEKLISNHDAQILNYMRLGKFKLGLLMNFNEQLLKNGLRRFKI